MKILNAMYYVDLPFEVAKSTSNNLTLFELSLFLRDKYKVEIDFISNYPIYDFKTISVGKVSKSTRLRELVRKVNEIGNNYDIINFSCISVTLFNAFAKYLSRDLKSKIVCTLHTSTSVGRTMFYQFDNIKKVTDEVKKLILVTPSNQEKEYLEAFEFNSKKLNNMKCEVINNYVNLNDLDIINKENIEKEYDIVINSTITPSKNSLEMLEYCVSRNLKTLYIGRYRDESNSLESAEYAKKCFDIMNNNQNIITYKKSLSHIDSLREMKKGKIFFHLSDIECFSLCVLENLSMGIPIVAKDIPSYKEIDESVRSNLFTIPHQELRRKTKNSRFEVYDKYIEKSKLESVPEIDIVKFKKLYSFESYCEKYWNLFNNN